MFEDSEVLDDGIEDEVEYYDALEKDADREMFGDEPGLHGLENLGCK